MSIPASPPPPRRTRRRLWLLLLASLALNLYWFQQRFGPGDPYGEEEFPPVSESLFWGDPSADHKVAFLRLQGLILPEAPSSLLGSPVDPVTALLREIRAASVDPSVAALLLEVDSPGGAVTSSDEIHRALLDFKAAAPGRKIVVHVRDMAASGAYYAALAGDHIVAQPTAIVGSVGVILSAINLHDLAERFGIRDVSLTSGANKALLSPLRPVDTEHNQILQRVVDDLYTQFRGLVLRHRPFDEAYAESHALLDGRVFTAPEAREHGLVDEVGYADAARAAVARLLGSDSLVFYSYHHSSGTLASLLQVHLPKPMISLPPQARFLYLWRPGL